MNLDRALSRAISCALAIVAAGCLSGETQRSERTGNLAVAILFPESREIAERVDDAAAIEEIAVEAFPGGDAPSFVAAASARAQFAPGDRHYRLELRVPPGPSYRVRVAVSGERETGEEKSEAGVIFGGQVEVRDLAAGETRTVEVRLDALVPRLSTEPVPSSGTRLRWTAVPSAARYVLRLDPPLGAAFFVTTTRTDTLLVDPPSRPAGEGPAGENTAGENTAGENTAGDGVLIARVRADTRIGLVSAFSESVHVPTPAPFPPGAVTDLRVDTTTDNSIELGWTAPGDDGQEGRAASYELRYDTAPLDEASFELGTDAGPLPLPAEAGAREAFVVSGLDPSTEYYFAVRAIDDAGLRGPLSNNAAGETLAPVDRIRPGRVLDLSAEALGEADVRLTWSAPGDDGAAGTASRYELRRSPSVLRSESDWALAEGIPNQLSPALAGTPQAFVAGGHARERVYYFAVRARDEADNLGPISNSPGVLTPDLTSPASVARLDLFALDETSVEVTWPSVGDDGDDGVAQSLELRRATFEISTEPSWEAATPVGGVPAPEAPPAIQTLVVAGLAPATRYWFALRAYDDAGNLGSLSPPASVTTLERLPEPPAALLAEAFSPRSIALTWPDPGDHEAAFVLERRSAGEPEFTEIAVLPAANGGDVAHLDQPLEDRTVYTYRVRSRNARGDSEPSPEASARTPLTAPSTLTVRTSSSTSLALEWAFLSEDLPDSFRVERNSGTGWMTRTHTSGDDTSFEDTFLSPGSTHTYRVRAVDSGEISAPSNEASGTTDDQPALCRVDPGQIDFGLVTIGEPSAETLTVTNDGGGTLSGELVAECGPFTIEGETTFSLGNGQSAEFVITFQPTGVPEESCALELGPTCPSVLLRGTGAEPARCELDAATLEFGVVPVGGATTRVLRLSNGGDALLQGIVAPIDGCPPFEVDPAALGPFSLEGGAELEIPIRYSPADGGGDDCVWSPSAGCGTVTLVGSGADTPVCAVSELALEFGEVQVGQSATRTFTISNVGGGVLQGRVEKGLGSECADFQIEAGGGNFSLSPSAPPRVVRVAYQPGEIGSDICAISLGATCGSLEAIGSGDLPPVCTVEPNPYDLGEAGIGLFHPFSITVTNTGGGTLHVDPSAQCGSAFQFPDGLPPFDLTASQSAEIDVVFVPVDEIQYACEIVLTPECSAQITGTGVGPTCVVDPPTLAFGNVGAEIPVSRSVTVRNEGGGILAGTLQQGSCADPMIMNAIDLPDDVQFALGPGEEESFDILFDPFDYGQEVSCALTAGPCVSIAVTGTGAHIDLTPTSLDFGFVALFAIEQRLVTFTNLSPYFLDFQLQDPNPADDFWIPNPDVLGLAPGASTSVAVMYSPFNVGYQSVTIWTNTYPPSFECFGNGVVGTAP